MEQKTLLAKIATNKSLLKEYNYNSNRVVYLNDNTEFQIQLFNPFTYTIGAEILLNGKNLNNYIVIKPGERIWLERYFDSNNKFIFETYEVENTAEVKNAIRNNGLVEVRFYKEKEVINNWNYNNIYYTNNNYDITATALSKNYDTTTTRLSMNLPQPDPITLFSCECSTGSVQSLNLGNNTIETGRIGKGNYSNQKFSNVNIDFENYWFIKEQIQILPASRKQINNNDLKKIYCHECGRKLNTKYKYCPYCGTKI